MSEWYRTILRKNYYDIYKNQATLMCPLIKCRKYKHLENSISNMIWSSKNRVEKLCCQQYRQMNGTYVDDIIPLEHWLLSVM